MAKARNHVIGRCKLCLADNSVLQSSHFLPQSVYKALRNVSGRGKPEPIVITPNEIKQTSAQSRAHLLCSKCEGVLGRNGEDWVSRNALKSDGRFHLLKILRRYPFVLDQSRIAQLYSAATIPEINVEAIAYFAASIFWRGSIYGWRLDGTRPVPLGPFEEPLRKFLLGQAEFPSDMTLSVTVRTHADMRFFTYEPIGEWRGTTLVAKFPMPGLAFGLSAGTSISDSIRRMCFVRGEGRPIAVTDAIERFILQDGVEMLKRLPEQRRKQFDASWNLDFSPESKT